MNALLQQLQNRQLIWQASQTEAPYEHCQSTGFTALDQFLGGGWPQHNVIELQSHGACAELQLIQKALERSGSELLQVWINPPANLCAEYLLLQKRPLHQVLQLNAPRSADALWAAELCLKSGSCMDVLLWQNNLNLTQLKRLQLAAAQGQSQLYFFRQAQAEQQLLPWALSLQLIPAPSGLQMAHDITPNAPHAIITVKLALNTLCGDTAADGLNDLLNPEIGAGFIADYALLHTDNPMIVYASEEPEEGELFVEPATWLVITKRDDQINGYHRVDSTLPLHLLAQDALATLLSGKFVIEPGEHIEVLKIDDLKRHLV